MSDVLIGKGKVSGMAFRAPRNTSLPAYPSEALSADYVNIGAISEDGIELEFPSGDVIRNWALVAERKANTENGKVTVRFLYTNQKTLETLVGAGNVTHTAASAVHGNVDTVEFAPDVSADPCAFVFLIKDGDKLALVGSTDALITSISNVSFTPDSAVIWEAVIEGTWTFMVDDGQVTS